MSSPSWMEEMADCARQAGDLAWREWEGAEESLHPYEELFRARLSRIYEYRTPFVLQFLERPTVQALGRYYRAERLIRIYVVDMKTGPRDVEELFEIFLHELTHHLEYYEPDVFGGHCEREHGVAHSPLFHWILETLSQRWNEIRNKDIGDVSSNLGPK